MKKTDLMLVFAAGLAACTGAAADHESLGDEAYVAREYGNAMLEYQLALRQGSMDVQLRLKAGMAALNGHELLEAATQFRSLAADDPDQVMIAANGLGRVARAASSEGNRPALQAALDGLRAIAPDRALGSFARELAFDEDGVSTDAIDVLPYAAAAAPDARIQDSLMFVYAVSLVRLSRCESAIEVFESLLRRGREPAVLSDARIRAASCALGVGRREQNRGSPEDAEGWYCRAIAVGDNNYAARAAYVGLGDVRFARGDYTGARDAYRRAMGLGTPSDSLYRAAQRGLDATFGFDLFGQTERSSTRKC